MPLLRAALLLACLAFAATPAAAQLAAASEGPIVYGHHHILVSDLAAHRTFWIEGLGGRPGHMGGDLEAAVFHNVIVFLRQGPPGGGTKGTTVNHIGFSVPDLRASIQRLQQAGYTMVTRAEVPATMEVKDDMAWVEATQQHIAYVMAPDQVKVELVEVKGQATPITMHHVHFYTPDVDAMKAWYVKLLDARPGKRGTFEAADLPGVNLTFSPSTEPVGGTKGRALDHVGFEVAGLEALCKRLEAAGIRFDRPYEVRQELGVAVAFLTDPWGTYIELSEGLVRMGR